MGLTRRQLLLTAGMGLGAVLFSGCRVPSREFQAQSPVELPEDLVTGMDNWYATLCRQCSNSEGIIVRVMEGRAKKVQGNPDYPVNLGKHSARCEAGLQALYHPDRIRQPLIRVGDRGSGDFEPAPWEDALDELASNLGDLRASPDTVAVVTEPLRGHLALVVERFVGSYGATHLALAPLEETNLRVAVRRLFSQDRLSHFDIRNTDFLLVFGADALGTWLSPVHYARQYGEFRQGGGRRRGTFVHVEPRMSMTAASADEWVPVKPGTEGVLALGLAYVIVAEGLGDFGGIMAMTNGRGAAALEAFKPSEVSRVTGVPEERIADLARRFARGKPSLAMGGGSAAAHSNGLFNLMAILSLNFLAGSVGQKGGVLFNPPPPIDDVPTLPATPFVDWQRFADRIRLGRPTPVKALIVRGANPVYALPETLGFREALAKVPFIASFASVMDETAAMADLVLPELVYLEDWGDDIPDPGPGFATVGVQQPVVRPLVDGRSFADVLLTVAEALGPDMKEALPWATFQDVVREAAQRLFELKRGSVEGATFEEFWVNLLANGGWWDPQEKPRGAIVLGRPLQVPEKPVLPSFAGAESEYPFHLIPFASNALGDGKEAHLPWLQAAPDPITTAVWQSWAEVNPRKAQELGLMEGEMVAVESPEGALEAPVYINPAMPPDAVAMPLGQGHTAYGRYAQGRGANVFALLSAVIDAETGALAWAATRVRLRKTGRRTRIPKYEGSVEARQLEERPIIQLTRPE